MSRSVHGKGAVSYTNKIRAEGHLQAADRPQTARTTTSLFTTLRMGRSEQWPRQTADNQRQACPQHGRRPQASGLARGDCGVARKLPGSQEDLQHHGSLRADREPGCPCE